MRILWLKTELLHPVDKGGKIRTYNMLKELKRAGHSICYLTLDDGSSGPDARLKAQEYCDELVRIPHRQFEKFSAAFYSELAVNLLSALPYAIGKYRSKAMHNAILKKARPEAFDVLVCDFLAPAVNVPKNIPIPTLLFQHNVEAMIWKRHYEVQANALKKSFLLGQWRKMLRFEEQSCKRFDFVAAVSAEDAETMRKEYGIDNIADIPTGVDTEFFRPSGSIKHERHNLVFTGSMDWLPNEDAIRYFTEQIMPIIKRTIPDVTLTVVGRNPYSGLVELSKREPSVVVTGRVDDVRPYMERAGAYVVPLRIGGGTRLKIYEAMAMENAIVSTSVGAEGLPVKNGSELLLADTPEDFADAVVRVLTDESLARQIGESAAKTVRERFGWNKVAADFAHLCEETVTRRRPAVAVPDVLSGKPEAAI